MWWGREGGEEKWNKVEEKKEKVGLCTNECCEGVGREGASERERVDGAE